MSNNFEQILNLMDFMHAIGVQDLLHEYLIRLIIITDIYDIQNAIQKTNTVRKFIYQSFNQNNWQIEQAEQASKVIY